MDTHDSMTEPRRRSWAEAIAVYTRGRVIGMAFLGFSAGLPFLLVFSTLSAWLREAGIAVAAIGFLSWIGVTYSVKVVWAPVIDNVALPWLTRRLGRRRGWMLPAQLGIALGLAGIAGTDPAAAMPLLVALALLVAFSSATQDVAVDAYRIEAVETRLQGAMAASYIFGYRVALLAAGAGALFAAEAFGWRGSYLIMALLALIGPATTLIIREPEANTARRPLRESPEVARVLASPPGPGRRLRVAAAWLREAVIAPFVDFFRRNGRIALVILLFIGVYRLSDITMGVMANPFYIDLGFTKSEIASVTKVFGFAMSLLGAFLGGTLVVRLGLMTPLLMGAALVAGTNLLFSALAVMGPDLGFLALTISADNLSGGLAGAVFVAYLSSLTNTAYTATQYALFSSLMTLPGKLLGGISGLVVEAHGYAVFFLYAAGIGIPAILIVVYLMHRRETRVVGAGEHAR